MYNLLVTSREGAWDKKFYEYDKSRFLEYTNEDITSAFEGFTQEHINTLKTYPCIFAYEGDTLNIRIGFLTSIKDRGRNLLIEYEIKENILNSTHKCITQ